MGTKCEHFRGAATRPVLVCCKYCQYLPQPYLYHVVIYQNYGNLVGRWRYVLTAWSQPSMQLEGGPADWRFAPLSLKEASHPPLVFSPSSQTMSPSPASL